MGGPTHQWVGPPIVTHGTNKGGAILQGGKWANNAHEPIVKGGTHRVGGHQNPLHSDVLCSC